MTKRYVLVHPLARQRAMNDVRTAPEGYEVLLREPKRSKDANAAMWPVLTAFATQIQWPVNGELTWMSEWDWKDVLTAAYEQELRVAEGLDGGHVMLGARTSDYSRSKFSGLLDFMHATAAARGVTVYQDERATA
jgi:2-phospho-L-lactate guanylyltransferase (CobY/MobA/RfbA family)